MRRLAGIPIVRRDGLTVTLRLSLVQDVSFARKANSQWLAAALHRRDADPLFNWVAVYNFNAASTVRLFSLHDGARAEALMLVRIGHVVRCDAGHRDPLVYVSFLEVAPWNRLDEPQRLFSGLGPIMLRLACDLSLQRGYNGRIGLHAVASAQRFYHRMGFASLDCPSEYNELYMELDEAGARALTGT